MEGSDICFAPVMDMWEAPSYGHNVDRKLYIEVNGVAQAAPSPRFSRTPNRFPVEPPPTGTHTTSVLLDDAGYTQQEIDAMVKSGVVALGDGTREAPQRSKL